MASTTTDITFYGLAWLWTRNHWTQPNVEAHAAANGIDRDTLDTEAERILQRCQGLSRYDWIVRVADETGVAVSRVEAWLNGFSFNNPGDPPERP